MINTSQPSVALIGPGAIGTTIAAALHESDIAVTVVGRSPRSQLRLDTDRGPVIVPTPVVSDVTRIHGPADVVFLAVKATQLAGAATWLEALCGPATVLCVLQNGIEQYETVAPFAPPCEVVPSIVWFPAQRYPDGRVQLRGDARLSVPNLPGGHKVQQLLEGTLCSVEISDDFATLAWRKLVQNAVAGLMALTGRRSAMFHRDDIAELATSYIKECLAVARADGAVLGDDEAARLLEKFRAFPGDMSTSILTDREEGRSLEWDARNGVVQRRGRLLGIPTPISDVVVPLLAATSDGPG